jgi:tRNA (cytidine/uridine-2'-O-)-methyltransferase
VLLTTQAATPYTDFAFAHDDILMVGRESAGVPDHVHAAAGARVVIPMRPGLRSLNVAVAAAMTLGEALRQTGSLPG